METANERFPRELLEQSKEARLAYFRGKVVAHPRLKEVHLALMNAIRQPAGVLLILVLGPTGVGKTTLRLRIEKQLREEAWSKLEQDQGRVPIVGIEAIAPASGNFDWKDYYSRVLLALDEPLVKYKIDYGTKGLRRNGSGQLAIGHDVAADQLRRTVELSLSHRRPMAVIVDEAQHLKKVAGSRRLLDQMDTLKSLAGTTGVVHVLMGTYELLGLANLSAQLILQPQLGRYSDTRLQTEPPGVGLTARMAEMGLPTLGPPPQGPRQPQFARPVRQGERYFQ